MSSYILTKKNENNDNISEHENYNEVEELLSQGVEKIYQSFKINTKLYNEKIKEQENIINNLSKKIKSLNQEVEEIQRENHYYKAKNEKQKIEIDKLNKIVNNIKGKLSNVDHQINEINECINDDNVTVLNCRKNNETKKKKNNLYIGLKNQNEEQSIFQLDSKNSLKVDKNENLNNEIKDKKYSYYFDNNILKNMDKNNNYENNKNFKTDSNEDDINKKFNKTGECDSFKLNLNINKNNYYKNSEKLKIKASHSVLNKNIINNEEEKKKNNNKEQKLKDKEIENSAYNLRNKKSKSFNRLAKENDIIYPNNKTIYKIELKKNSDDLNINKIISNNKNDKGYEEQICYTYDNLFNKINTVKKNSFNSFRNKIINRNISDFFTINDKHQNNHLNINNLYEKTDYIKISNFIDKKSEQMSYFLKKCKILLNKDSFEEIIKLFKEYKDGLITDEGILLKTQNYLENNKELIELINVVFKK